MPAYLRCQIVFDGASHDATIVNISMRGAFVSSPSMPPIGSTIGLVVKSRELKAPLELEATVVRGTHALSDYGTVGRFGIRFSRNATELIQLIAKLQKKYA